MNKKSEPWQILIDKTCVRTFKSVGTQKHLFVTNRVLSCSVFIYPRVKHSHPSRYCALLLPYNAGAKVYAITIHLKPTKMSPTRGILSTVGGFGCLKLCFYGIRELASATSWSSIWIWPRVVHSDISSPEQRLLILSLVSHLDISWHHLITNSNFATSLIS